MGLKEYSPGIKKQGTFNPHTLITYIWQYNNK
jgi:hypothetical protein